MAFSASPAWVRGLAAVALALLAAAGFAVSVRADDARASDATTWLCNPWSINDPCRNNETASVETASGATSIEWAHPQFDPPIDCFYVYPTVSQQIAANANDEVEPQETAIATDQASRFSQKCRVYAPMYPQVTLFALALEAIGFGEVSQSVVSTAYRGVLAAWDEYLADYNDGRGVVLIGHSQGAAMLIRLIKSEIDGSPAERGLLVAAYLMGGQVTVPIGKSVGGDFRSVPSCRSAAQTGCVVAYSSYLRTPPSGSGFGRVGPNNLAGEPSAPANAGELQILCVNPAQLVSGAAGIHPYFPTERFPGLLGLAEGAVPSALTPWVTYPAKYTASCRYEDDTSWLQVDDVGPPNDVRPSVEEAQGPAIGLHLADLNIESGDLVSLMGMQRESYLSGR